MAGGNEERPVYVQTASGQNIAAQKSAVEHCFTMFSDVNGHLPTERKLDDEVIPEWRPEMINLLSGVAYVGTWTARDQWTEFVWGAGRRGLNGCGAAVLTRPPRHYSCPGPLLHHSF